MGEGSPVRRERRQGVNPIRGIELAVGTNIYRLEYAPRFFKPHFRNQACWDVGAVWRVKVNRLADLGELINATCTGKMDEWAHEPVLLAKNYLNVLAKNPAASSLSAFSLRWKNSPEFEKYQATARSLDLSDYPTHGGRAGCLEVVKIERPSRTEVRSSDCAIKLRGIFVILQFSVVQDVGTKRWEIDEIKIE
jgi:hypothetical protein